jgi:hypothetical protein
MNEKRLRESLEAALAAAHQEHLDEASGDPAIKKQSRGQFLSVYGPASDDDDLIEFFARRSHQNRLEINPKEKR